MRMAQIKYSEFQIAIFDAIKNTNSNILVNAVAGSGKTFTSVEAAKQLPSSLSVAFVAFNRSIVNELNEKFEGTNVEAKTMHSMGFRTFMNYGLFPKMPDTRKKELSHWQRYVRDNVDMLSSIISRENKECFAFCGNVDKIFDIARLNLLHHGDIEAITDLCDTHGFTCIADEISVVNEMLKLAYSFKPMGKSVELDFTDLITLPTQNQSLRRYVPKYDVLFVDEAQDLSKAQQQLMMLLIKKNGRFIAVGDPRQAINGFAGAMCDSFAKLADLPNTIQLPLSYNYRCGRKMIDLAQEIVPNIIAHEGAIEGVVNNATDLKSVGKGDMIICRKSAPLVGVCLKLIANGKSAYIKGNDICKGLLNLIKKMKVKNLNDLFNALDVELEKVKSSLIKFNPELAENIESCPKVINLKDKIEALQYIAETSISLNDLENKLNSLFTEIKGGNCITLSTVHKAKGLESDNVYIILPDCLPLVWKGQKEWQHEQEMNLRYVALTRAKKTLTFVNLNQEQLREVVVA